MTAEAERRRLILIGIALTLFVAVIGAVGVIGRFGERPVDDISVKFDLPYAGQGVSMGTPVMMHGVKVGSVTAVSSLPNGKVRLGADLESGPIAGLTDALGVDFRPANYFGVTSINLLEGPGGRPLRDGAHIDTVPQGNFTLQALLSRLGEITGGVVTPQLISVVDRATRYTDGLNPLIETMVTTANAITTVQTVSTEQLLRNTAGISVALPSFVDDATAAGYDINQGSGFVTFNVSNESAMPGADVAVRPGQPQSEEYWRTRSVATLDLVANSFFGAIGKLLSSHPGDLLPAVGLVKTITDAVPGLVAPAGIADTMVELRTRFEKLYGGTAEQRALQVHVVLDNLPGVQAPINAMGGP
ncbi:MlaD family protein [Mycobacterium sp. shizuoka-1]|uniref:MlaD family protein n=1 Tax=Mycobacterium sp. shizuoka-1 TaxID=2039281 RepID=UPI000C075259|nr:MlaD family protein [Mycobacterium sp. shizuoka-1]